MLRSEILVLAHDLEQRIGAAKTEVGRQVIELGGSLALALQQFFDCFAATGDGGLLGHRVEPGAHLGAGALAAQVAQLGVKPVHRRATFLGRDDLDRLTALEWRVQRHHGPVDAGALDSGVPGWCAACKRNRPVWRRPAGR